MFCSVFVFDVVVAFAVLVLTVDDADLVVCDLVVGFVTGVGVCVTVDCPSDVGSGVAEVGWFVALVVAVVGGLLDGIGVCTVV